MTRRPVFILNGPNLNMLGVREPHLYGTQTLADLEAFCKAEADTLGIDIDFRQSNHEGDLVDWIQESHETAAAILLNAAAYARTSMAIQSAVRAVSTPILEIHITNIYTKESYRPKSLLSCRRRHHLRVRVRYLSPGAHGGRSDDRRQRLAKD